MPLSQQRLVLKSFSRWSLWFFGEEPDIPRRLLDGAIDLNETHGFWAVKMKSWSYKRRSWAAIRCEEWPMHIALELAYQIRNKKPESSIFWISTSVEKIEQTYINVWATKRDTCWYQWVPRKQARGFWLIIDNADDMGIWATSDGSSPALKIYVPQSKYGIVLFTTRNQQLAIKLVGPEAINIPQMDDEMVIDMLRALNIWWMTTNPPLSSCNSSAVYH